MRWRSSSTNSTRNSVQWVTGEARFIDPLHIEVGDRDRPAEIHGAAFHHRRWDGGRIDRPNIPFDGDAVLDPDEILELKRVPRSLVVIGGGVIGVEYATIFSGARRQGHHHRAQRNPLPLPGS